MLLLLLLINCAGTNYLAAEEWVTVHNESPKTIYVALYYVAGKSGETRIKDKSSRWGDLVALKPKESVRLKQPPRKLRTIMPPLYYDRDIYFAYQDTNLQPTVDKHVFRENKEIGYFNVGSFYQGAEVYVAEENGMLVGRAETTQVADNMNISNSSMGYLFTSFLGLFGKYHHPFDTQKAIVRFDAQNSLCDEEIVYLMHRIPRVQAALNTYKSRHDAITNNELVPRVAFCCSGGGYRAMVATIGALVAAEQGGLIDLTTYLTGLSGSTWAIMGWQQSYRNAADYLDQLAIRIAKHPIKSFSEIDIIQALQTKIAFKAPLSFIDIYGALLADRLITGLTNKHLDPARISLGGNATRYHDGSMPLPVCTAILADTQPYSWMEFTPFEVMSNGLQSAVPTWSFGRRFHAGSSVDFAPPQPLGFGMGIWGSAMSVSVADIIRVVIKPTTTLGALLALAMEATPAGQYKNTRMYPAQVWNWNRGSQGKQLDTLDKLTLVDAGIDVNLPVLPLLRPERAVDIMIVVDASDATPGAELKKAEQLARANNRKFPPIDTAKLSQVFSIHKDPNDPTVPVIVYIPLVPNQKYENGWNPLTPGQFTSTFNFEYTVAQTKQLAGITSAALREALPAIMAEINENITRKIKG